MYLSPNFYTNQHSIALFVDLSFIEMFKKVIVDTKSLLNSLQDSGI
jgi:hypothetical protein